MLLKYLSSPALLRSTGRVVYQAACSQAVSVKRHGKKNVVEHPLGAHSGSVGLVEASLNCAASVYGSSRHDKQRDQRDATCSARKPTSGAWRGDRCGHHLMRGGGPLTQELRRAPRAAKCLLQPTLFTKSMPSSGNMRWLHELFLACVPGMRGDDNFFNRSGRRGL